MKKALGFIGKYNAFLRWWLIFSALCVAAFFAYDAGMLQKLFEADKTGVISLSIFGLFCLFTVMIGVDILKLCRSGYTKNIEKRMDVGWFFSDGLITLGMTGTVIGFIMMLEHFSSDLTTKIALAAMSRGMGTALYTTAAGIIGSFLLKLQLINGSIHMEECKEVCELTDVE